MSMFSRFKIFVEDNQDTLSQIFFVLLLFSSLLAGINLPSAPFGGLHYVLLTGLSLAAIAISSKHTLRSVYRLHKRTLIVLGCLYLWMWVSALFSEFASTAIFYSLKYSIYFIVFLAFLPICYTHKKELFWEQFIFRLLLLISLLGILEFIVPNLTILDLIRSPDFYPRITSILQEPNQFGILMSVGAILALIFYQERAISKFEFSLSLSLFIISFSLVASKTTWLVFMIGLGMLWLYKTIKIRGAILIVSTLAVCILFLPVSTEQVGLNHQKLFPLLHQGLDQSETIQPAGKNARNKFTTRNYAEDSLWNVAIDEFIKRPITGIGNGVFSNHIQSQYSPKNTGFYLQNIFLQTLVELGSPGLLLLILLIWNLVKTINLRAPQFAIPITIFIVSHMVNSMLNDYAFTVIELYFWANASNWTPLPTSDYRLGS